MSAAFARSIISLGYTRRWQHDYWRSMTWQAFRAHIIMVVEERERYDRDEPNADDPSRDDDRFGSPPPDKELDLIPWDPAPSEPPPPDFPA